MAKGKNVKKSPIGGRCCVLTYTIDGVMAFTLSADTMHTARCTNADTNGMRYLTPVQFSKLAKYQPLPDAAAVAAGDVNVFPDMATALDVVCTGCRTKVFRWDPVVSCGLCHQPATVGTVRNLGRFAKDEDAEDCAWKVCGACSSKRRHIANALKNPPVQSPSKDPPKGGRLPGRPPRLVTGMSCPAGPRGDRVLCDVDGCPGLPGCKKRHSGNRIMIGEEALLVPIFNRIACANLGGTCLGVMHIAEIVDGNIENKHIDMVCPACSFEERLQLQADLLALVNLDAFAEVSPSTVATDKVIIPVPADIRYGGLSRKQIKQLLSVNTALGIRLLVAASSVGIPLKRFSQALDLAGITMPIDNYKKGFGELLVLESVAEATKWMGDKMNKLLESLPYGKGKGGLRDKIAGLDCGWGAPRNSQNGVVTVAESAPSSKGLGILLMVAMSRNAKEADVKAGIAKYMRSAESMESAGMEAALEELTKSGKVYVVVTDGDTASKGILLKVFKSYGTDEGWHHLYDINHLFKNCFGVIENVVKDPGWRAEHAAAPNTNIGGRVVGCADYVGAAGATGKTKLCRVVSTNAERFLMRRGLRFWYEQLQAWFLDASDGVIKTTADFATKFRGGIERCLQHSFDNHAHCHKRFCSKVPGSEKVSLKEPLYITCPASQRAVLAAYDAYFDFETCTHMVAPLVGNPLNNRVEATHSLNARFNPKGVYRSSRAYVRGLMMSYLEANALYLARNSDERIVWQSELLAIMETTLQLPAGTLALTPLSQLRSFNRLESKIKESIQAASVEAKRRINHARATARLSQANILRKNPGVIWTEEQCVAKGYAGYIGKGGGLVQDKKSGKQVMVVCDKQPTSRANTSRGAKRRRVDTGTAETAVELKLAYHRLCRQNSLSEKFASPEWDNPSKLDKSDKAYRGYNSKGFWLSKTAALQAYLETLNQAGPA